MRKTSTIKSNIGKHLEAYSLGTHLCSIFSTAREQYSVIIPYIRIGLSRNEQSILILDDAAIDGLYAAIASAGIDVGGELRADALVFVRRQQLEKPLESDPAGPLIDFLSESVRRAKKKGFAGLRVLADMSLLLDDSVRRDRPLALEAELDAFLQAHDASMLCQYDRTRFSSEVIEEMLYIHPLVIFADMVCNNIHHIPPDQYLGANSADRRVDQLLIGMSISEYRRQCGNN